MQCRERLMLGFLGQIGAEELSEGLSGVSVRRFVRN